MEAVSTGAASLTGGVSAADDAAGTRGPARPVGAERATRFRPESAADAAAPEPEAEAGSSADPSAEATPWEPAIDSPRTKTTAPNLETLCPTVIPPVADRQELA